MAGKKSAEEMMLEAELSSSAGNATRADGDRPVHEDAMLPGETASRAREGGRLPGKLGNRRVIIGVVVAVAIVAIAVAVVMRVMFYNSTDIWDGTADTSWYSENMTSMEVTTAEQLAGMRELCNEGVDFKDVKFRLARNLDLYEIPTKPIGDGRQDGSIYHRFRGSFDGGGHTISGINVEEDMWDYAGLFGSVDDGDLSNLTVEGKVTGQVRVGGVVGELNGGSITNCTNRCKVSSTKTATSYYPVTVDVGGVCGIWLGIVVGDDAKDKRLENLVNEGEVSARACSAGGVIGTLANCDGVTAHVSNLRNDGNVTVYCESDDRDEAVGGVIGTVGGLGTDLVSDLSNYGNVSCSTVLSVGGVFGAVAAPQRVQKDDGSTAFTEGIQIEKCTNAARVAANADDERAHVGGIVGYLEDPDVTFDGCENTGALAATNGKSDDIASTNGAEVWDEWEDEHPATWS